MHVAQFMQHGLVFFTHAARKIRIIQMLISRRLRHILQHAQPLPNRSLAVRGQLLPFRQHIIADVFALFRRHLLPDLRPIAQLLLLLRRQLIETPLILLQFLLLFGGQVLRTNHGVQRPVFRSARIPWRRIIV